MVALEHAWDSTLDDSVLADASLFKKKTSGAQGVRGLAGGGREASSRAGDQVSARVGFRQSVAQGLHDSTG